MKNGNTSILSIQYLRGIAAIAVLIFHTSETYNAGFRSGAAGVDLFFIISGVVMWVTTSQRNISPSAFMRRRIIRIVPLYWVATLVTYVCVILKPNFFYDQNPSPTDLLWSLAFLPPLKGGALHPVVVQGWTLSYEIFFYIIFALTLLSSESRRLATCTSFFALAVALHSFAPIGYATEFTRPLLFEFVIGLLIGIAWTKDQLVPTPVATLMVAAGVICLALDSVLLSEINRLMRWGIPSALVVTGLLSIERRAALPQLKFLHLLGDASYSIYIWHVLLGTVFIGILLRTGIAASLVPFLTVFFSVFSALVAHVAIERPLNRFLVAGLGRVLGQVANQSFKQAAG
ncbi:acyltransferase family protein [Methylobacterium sp. P31]